MIAFQQNHVLRLIHKEEDDGHNIHTPYYVQPQFLMKFNTRKILNPLITNISYMNIVTISFITEKCSNIFGQSHDQSYSTRGSEIM